MTKHAAAAAAFLLVLTACGESTEPRVPTAVQLDRQTATLEFGDTLRLQATIVDQAGRAYDVPPEGFDISWSSSTPGVVSVSNTGLLTAGGYGQATITAEAGTLPSVQAQVEVEPRLLDMQLSFTYTGTLDGSFQIDETERITDIDWFGNWTFTEYNVEWDDQDILAQRLRADGLYDILYFWVDGAVTTPGTLDASDGIFVVGFDNDMETEEGFYQVTSGSVTFQAVDDRTMVGTFALGLQELEGELTHGDGTIDIDDGTFSLPLVTPAEYSADPVAPRAAQLQLSPSALERLRERVRDR